MILKLPKTNGQKINVTLESIACYEAKDATEDTPAHVLLHTITGLAWPISMDVAQFDGIMAKYMPVLVVNVPAPPEG